MNTRFPPLPPYYSVGFFSTFFATLQSYFSRAVAHDEETPRIILRSPNGTRYDLKVSDAGAVVITPTGKVRA